MRPLRYLIFDPTPIVDLCSTVALRSTVAPLRTVCPRRYADPGQIADHCSTVVHDWPYAATPFRLTYTRGC